MAKAEKLDLFKEHRSEYVAKKTPTLVKVAPARYLALDGHGEPGGEAFQADIAALYGLAFTMKMASKFAGRDYRVCPLEGIWWADPKYRDPARVPMDQWRWKLLIRVPSFIRASHLAQAKQALRAKSKPPEFEAAGIERIAEGPCVQMLHVGPYSAEEATVAKMAEFARSQGLRFAGRHHEVYLSDPRRVPPERLRTILRQPVRR